MDTTNSPVRECPVPEKPLADLLAELRAELRTRDWAIERYGDYETDIVAWAARITGKEQIAFDEAWIVISRVAFSRVAF